MTAVLTHAALCPDDVRDVLARSILADGLDFVLDIDRSSGSYLVDARTGERYLDMFTFFASSALGMNHPALADDEDFRAELAQAAVNKPSNSDIYSVPMARFVSTFARVLGDPALPHLFFVDGEMAALFPGKPVPAAGAERADSKHDHLTNFLRRTRLRAVSVTVR